MRRYPEYKDSSIEWIGEIPEHWNVKRLKFITRINPSKTEDNIVKNSIELVTFLPAELEEQLKEEEKLNALIWRT